jgi:uncharacterized membrane protein YdjX (TVP38/TMEM64 family)
MDHSASSGPVKKSRLPLYISISIIVVFLILYFAVPEINSFFDEAYDVLTSQDEQRISNWVEQLGFWGPLLLVLGMIVQMFLIIVPSPLLMLVAVLAYGKIWGALLGIASVLIASSVGYWLGAYLGAVSVEKMIGEEKEKKLESVVHNYGAWAVVLFRLIPFLSNDAISFVGGLLGMRYWKFIAATLVGITPLAVLIAYFGENNERLKNGMIWVAGVGVVFFIGYYFYQKRKDS